MSFSIFRRVKVEAALTTLSDSRRAVSGERETPSPYEHKRRAEPTISQQHLTTVDALGLWAPAAPPAC